MVGAFLLAALVVVLAIAFGPQIVQAVSWWLMFLILLMLGDLALRGLRSIRRGSRKP